MLRQRLFETRERENGAFRFRRMGLFYVSGALFEVVKKCLRTACREAVSGRLALRRNVRKKVHESRGSGCVFLTSGHIQSQVGIVPCDGKVRSHARLHWNGRYHRRRK